MPAPARDHDSGGRTRRDNGIGKSKSPLEIVGAKRHFVLGLGVHDRVAGGAKRTQFVGAEGERTDRRPAAAEDEVVGTDPDERELRVLDREEVVDGAWQRSISILDTRPQLTKLVVVFDESEPPVDVDLEAPRRSPAPRISRSRIAIWKPAPSSV